VQVAELVQTEQVDPPVAADDLGQLALVLGLDELVDEGGSGDVADPETAGPIEGVAPRSNSARRLIRGNLASAIRRSRRRASRSSTSALKSSAR
jgi:hypothetical protein